MTQNYIITREQFLIVKETWAKQKSHSASEHIIYNALRSKPLDLGFVERKSNIQGCDSWYGFKEPKKDAIRAISQVNPWEKYKDTQYHRSYEGGQEQIKNRNESFKRVFGIQIPETLLEVLNSTAK